MELGSGAESFRILRTFEFADNADRVACAQQDPEDMEKRVDGLCAINETNQATSTSDNRRINNMLKEDVSVTGQIDATENADMIACAQQYPEYWNVLTDCAVYRPVRTTDTCVFGASSTLIFTRS